MADDSVPSAGWRAVYAACGASTDVESRPPRRSCPDCGEPSLRLRPRTFRCPDHGAWRVPA